MEIADKLIELRIVSRRIILNENRLDKKKNALSLKLKFLYAIKDKPLSPAALMSMLTIVKTNLAILAQNLVKEGLVEKLSAGSDKRAINFKITQSGKEYLNLRLKLIDDAFKKVFSSDEEYAEAANKMQQVLDLMSFMA